MIDPRAEALAARLEKGRIKTLEIMHALTPGQWHLHLYEEPTWCVRDLLAHFVSSERQLLLLAQNIAAGGTGAPPDLDINRFNAEEQKRLEGLPPEVLLEQLDKERQETIEWVRSLDSIQLDRIGQHPMLGEINIEVMVTSIYGHQLLHMRDLSRLLGSVV